MFTLPYTRRQMMELVFRFFQAAGFSPPILQRKTKHPNPRAPRARRLLRTLPFLPPLLAIGCVHRVMNFQTNPPGAVVYLNDREIGRTPFKREFLWYGTYDVVIRKDGYQTLKTVAYVIAPFWQFVPLDALTDFMPLYDQHYINFALKPETPVDPQALIARAQAMRADLQTGLHTVNRAVLDVEQTTRPATGPGTTQAGSTEPSATQPAATVPSSTQP